MMLERLLYLKYALGLLVLTNIIPAEYQLVAMEWEILAQLKELLEPFMLLQKKLEGDKYVTSSLLLPMLHHVRTAITKIVAKPIHYIRL